VRARREASGEGGVIEVTYDRADMANKSAQVVQRLSELVDPTDNRWTNETAGNYTMTEEVERWEAEGGKPYSIYYTVNDKLFDHLRFEVLLELYNTKDAQLPHKIAEYIADVDQTPTNFTAVEMLENEKYYFVLYNASKMVGGGLDELHGVTLSKDGQFLSGQFLGSAYPSSGPDGDGEDYSYNYDPEKHILTMTNTKIQWDEQSQQEVSTESISKYKVDGEGTIVEVK
jgi:hypothetical protein